MKISRQAILLINGVPYTFPRGFIENEDYAIGSNIQLPTKADEAPIITPEFRTASISLSIPLSEWKNRLAYKSAKEMIRVTQFAFAQRNDFTGTLNGGNNTGQNINLPSAQPNVSSKKLTIPFTNLQVPWEIQISCAYIGINVQLACCILSSFSVSSNPKSSDLETWHIGLTEYDVSQLRGHPNDAASSAESTLPEYFSDALKVKTP